LRGSGAEAAKRVFNIERPVWMSLPVEELDGKVINEFVVAVVTAANDSDLEQKLAAMLFVSGVGVEQSRMSQVHSGVQGRFGGDAEESVETGPAWELGQIFEGLGPLEEAARQSEKAAGDGNVKGLWKWDSLLLNNDSGCHFRE
jgi:hypothetical protein